MSVVISSVLENQFSSMGDCSCTDWIHLRSQSNHLHMQLITCTWYIWRVRIPIMLVMRISPPTIAWESRPCPTASMDNISFEFNMKQVWALTEDLNPTERKIWCRSLFTTHCYSVNSLGWCWQIWDLIM